MNFGEKLKLARQEKQMQQKKLSELSGVSLRTIQNWESGARRPSHFESVAKVAAVLEIPVGDLLEDADHYIITAEERGGAASRRDVEALVAELSGLFAGGELDEAEKDGVMAALNEAYWLSKEINRKYAKKK